MIHVTLLWQDVLVLTLFVKDTHRQVEKPENKLHKPKLKYRNQKLQAVKQKKLGQVQKNTKLKWEQTKEAQGTKARTLKRHEHIGLINWSNTRQYRKQAGKKIDLGSVKQNITHEESLLQHQTGDHKNKSLQPWHVWGYKRSTEVWQCMCLCVSECIHVCFNMYSHRRKSRGGQGGHVSPLQKSCLPLE